MPPIADSMRFQPGSVASYPNTDPEALVSLDNKSAEPTKTTATPSTSLIPPKHNNGPQSSPRSRSKQPWRPRLGSSDGPSPRQTMRKASSSRRLVEPPPALERSSSSNRLRTSSPVGELRHNLTRSLSSSSVTSCGSVASADGNNSKMRDMNYLMQRLHMRTQKYGEEHPKVGACWNRIGNAYFVACQYPHALDAYKHAVMCYQTGEPELACTYGNMGTAYWASGRPDKAIQFLHKALDVYEYHEIAEGRNADESLTVASTLYHMGLCHTLLKNYSDALKCLKKCQKIQGKVLGPMDIQVGRTLDAIGKVHYFREDYTMALNCHEEARRIKAMFGDSESPAVIISWLNIGACHAATKNYTAALNKYTKVMHLQKTELSRCRNEQGQPCLARAARELRDTLVLIGDVHRQMEQDDLAQQYYKEASQVYEEAGLEDEEDSRPNMK